MTDAELRQLERDAAFNPILRRKLVREQRRRDPSWKDRRREGFVAKLGGLGRIWERFFLITAQDQIEDIRLYMLANSAYARSGQLTMPVRRKKRTFVELIPVGLPQTIKGFRVLGRDAVAAYGIPEPGAWFCKWAPHD